MRRRKSVIFLVYFYFSFLKASYGCSGSASFAAARNRALAASNLDPEMRAAKCERADYGVYKASDLRKLATLYPEGPAARPLSQGGKATCDFDSSDEGCSWFSVVPSNSAMFNRANFETTLDLEKFHCTSDRTFPFTGAFLLAGGEDRVDDGTAILETIIPCQIGKGILKFDYWMNNETPVLKTCIVPEDNPNPLCEEAKLDLNPLTFEIPGSEKPFRVRIQVDFIGSNDVVMLDNIDYEAQLCEVLASETPKIKAEGNTQVPEDNPTNGLQHLPELTLFGTTAPVPIDQTAAQIDFNQNSINDPVPAIPDSTAILPDTGLSTSVEHLVNKNDSETYLDACKALVCNFNYDDACYFRLSGLASTAAWQIGKNLLGNPHTGIHKPNPKDNTSGFIYVGLDGNDFSNEVFVLESPRFKLKEPAYLFFDVYQRSMGVQLKVCINGFEDCPYSNPPLRATEFWHADQQLYLPTTSEKVYFLASKVRQNLYLAIDNIRLQTLDGHNYCPATSNIPQHSKRYFD